MRPFFRKGGYTYELGSIEYIYWTSLGICYLTEVRVNNLFQRLGLGSLMVDYCLDELRRNNIGSIYAYTVSPEGFGLLIYRGFLPTFGPPSLPPWRVWLHRKVS